ncbi:RHS repeat-associated core domain-containing protein [Acinetobacter boissieri]|uniref:RHS repeat-associated core domain-containing protein n=1 Tax=Acinetobacter boissieri TaxID=1219383 RepID=A0A1G6JVB3_9GAMM|nr:RHS repeat-associated core domain-containing protein [Acinetobacter boissieri]SDC21936.1 RHS repeat-associated core domain-containing protein [Acinetobacter boissieri]
MKEYKYIIDGEIKHTLKNQYDEFDQLISTINDQLKSEYVFDGSGNLIIAKNQNIEIRNTYNPNRELLEKFITSPLEGLINKVLFRKENNHQTIFDQLGLISDQRIKDQQPTTLTEYKYEKGAALQQSSGLFQQKYMDDFGRTVIDDSSTHGLKVIKHNALDLPVQVIDENGLIENYNYDTDGRLVQVSFKRPDEDKENIIQKTEYDGTKKIKQISLHEIQTWQYFSDGKLKQHDTYSSENIDFLKNSSISQKPINHFNESYEYNAQGLLQKEQRHDLSLVYSYNMNQQVNQIKATKNSQTLTIDNMTWNAFQQMTHYRLSTGQQLWRKYDARGRLVQQIWSNPAQSVRPKISNYVYDLVNRLIYSDEQGSKYYQYDEQDQLTAIWQPFGSITEKKSWQPVVVYAYDSQGNRRLSWKKDQQKETLNHYNYQNNYLIGVTSHPVHGKRIETGYIERLAAYNNIGQPFITWKNPTEIHTLAQYLMSANTDAPVWFLQDGQWYSPEQNIQKTFNIDGLISARTVNFTQQRRFSQRFQYTQHLRTQERDQFDFEQTHFATSRDYIIFAGMPLAQYSEATTNGKTLESSFNPIQFNHVGAPIEVLDEFGATKWSTEYSAFGERENTQDGHLQEALISRVKQNLPITQSLNDLRFAPYLRLPGQYEDPTTGLYDNGYRQYDPQVGRYLSADPLGTIDGLNLYLYVKNNPLNKIDPLGLYQTDMHYYVTYFLAITAGIDVDRARRIALATQFVDTNDYTSPFDDEKGAVSNGITDASDKRLDFYHFVNDRSGIDKYDGEKLPKDTDYSRYYDGNFDLNKAQNTSGTDYKTWRVTSNLEGIPQLITMTNNYKKAARCNNENLSMQFFGEYLHAFGDTFSHRDQENDPFGVSLGTGHGFSGSNPDYTYNHNGEQKLSNLQGKGWWGVNEDRSLSAEQEIYKKLVDYRVNVLKQPETAHVIPWQQLSSYLKTYNAIHEHLEPETDVGSLDSVKNKIQYLQDLLNGGAISLKGSTAYETQDIEGNPKAKITKDLNKVKITQGVTVNTTPTGWNFGKEFKLIIGTNKVENKEGREQKTSEGVIANKDGYRIAEALKQRIEVFQDLTSQQKSSYKNVIWNSGVSNQFEPHDGDQKISEQLKAYRLKERSFVRGNDKAFTVTGTPPTDVIAGVTP